MCVCAPMYVELVWGATATAALVLSYMCAYAHVNIYIYVNIYDRVCMHSCMWN